MHFLHFLDEDFMIIITSMDGNSCLILYHITESVQLNDNNLNMYLYLINLKYIHYNDQISTHNQVHSHVFRPDLGVHHDISCIIFSQ